MDSNKDPRGEPNGFVGLYILFYFGGGVTNFGTFCLVKFSFCNLVKVTVLNICQC